MWLRNVKEETGERPGVDWRPFVLEQVNSKQGPEWKVWEQPEEYPARGMLALKAGEAAKRQGQEAFDNFHLALLKARHEARKDVTKLETILEAARETGLDTGRLQEDMKDPDILQTIAASHTEATQKHGAFGVPTFVFPDGRSAFLKMFYPSRQESVEVYEALTKLMSKWANIGEIKRPQPPWPAGVK